MVVVGLHLSGWNIADLAVEALVVKPFDIGKGGEFDVIAIAPGSLGFD